MSHALFGLALVLFCCASAMAQSTAACSLNFFERPFNNSQVMSEGINRYGNIVGSAVENRTQIGFIRYNNGSFARYMAPNSQTTQFFRRNAQGVNVGTFSRNGFAHGFALQGSTFRQIDVPGAAITYAMGINLYGTIVGTHTSPQTGRYSGYRLKNGAFTTIKYPNAIDTEVWSISDTGVIVGTYNREHGFVLINGQFTQLDYPGAQITTLHDINAKGEIVGNFYPEDTSGPTHAFIYRNGVFKEIKVSNAVWAVMGGINGYSIVTGVAGMADGSQKPFYGKCQ